MEKQIILLNGPSSSGKSTLSKALQNLVAEKRNQRYEIISIDDFLTMNADEPIYEDDVFAISAKMCEETLAALDRSCGVIVDHVITSERIFNQLKATLDRYPILTVRVTCPLEILRQREEQRKNRCLGSAEASDTYLFPKDGYCVTVDTHGMTPSECSLRIYQELV